MEVDSRDILYKLMDEFGLRRGSTIERLKLQKTVYLLQAAGLKLGYGFSWYKYGPYSQELVYDAYRVKKSERPTYEERTSEWSFSKNTIEWFRELKEKLRGVLNDPRMLELVASLDFVRTVWHPDMKQQNAPELFRKYKTRFCDSTPIEDSQIEEAFDLCIQVRQ